MNFNTHFKIQLYQYATNKTFKYRRVLKLPNESFGNMDYSNDEVSSAKQTRLKWQEELTNHIKPYIVNESLYKDFADCFGTQYGYRWTNLPNLSESNLQNTNVLIDVSGVDGFYYDESKAEWQLGDNFLVPLKKRFQRFNENSETNLRIAGRLFFFHEILHHCKAGHGIIREIANGIGRFPKVIEDADYQADVWAIINHYLFSKQNEANLDLKQFFQTLIVVAIETMFTFLDRESELVNIPIRSVNRILIWHYQLAQIKKLETNNIESCVAILFDKPVIEISGPEVYLIRDRVSFDLKAAKTCQVAVFTNKNIVNRFIPEGSEYIIEGIKSLNRELILRGMSAIIVTIDSD